jgi:hypothetical protein
MPHSDQTGQPAPDAPYSEATQEAWAALQRYTGWLGRDRPSKRTRAAVAPWAWCWTSEAVEATVAAIAKVTSEVERLEAS